MPSDRTIRRHRLTDLPVLPGWKEGQPLPTSTLLDHALAAPSLDAEGPGAAPEHSQAKSPSRIVGASEDCSSLYPPASQAQSDLSLPDRPRRKPAKASPPALGSELDRLRQRRAEAARDIKHLVEFSPELQRLQDIIDDCDAQERELLR